VLKKTASKKSSEVVVKKVKAYPIAASLKTEASALPAQIMKLTSQGLLAEVGANALKPGEKLECSFEIPVIHRAMTQSVVIVKMYSRTGGSLIELHFLKLSAHDQKSIANFLHAIRQVE
jgi:hypothetical protein